MKFKSWTITDEENEMPTFTADIVASPHLKKTLTKGHLLKNTIEIFSGTTNVLGPNRGFFIEEILPSSLNTITISGRGYEVLTLDEPIRDFVHWYNGKLSDLLKNTIDSSDITKVKYRSADITDSGTAQDIEIEHDTLFEIAHESATVDGYKFHVERHGSDFRFFYGPTTRGSKTNPTRAFSIGGETELTENTETIQGMFNEYVIKGRPETRIEVTVPSATNPHADATLSQSTFGKITKVIIDSSVEDTTTAANKGLQRLNKTALPIKEFDFKTTKFRADLLVGDFVNVVDNTSGLNVVEEVKGFTKKYILGTRKQMTVDLVNTKERSVKDLKDSNRSIKKRRNDLPFDPQTHPYYRDTGWVRASSLDEEDIPGACSGNQGTVLEQKCEDNLPSDFTPTGGIYFIGYWPKNSGIGGEATAWDIYDQTASQDIHCDDVWDITTGKRWASVTEATNRSGNTIRYYDNAATASSTKKLVRLITVVT